MNKDTALDTPQAMEFVEGKINITSGAITGSNIIHCVADGGLTLLFPSGGTVDVTMTTDYPDRTIVRGSTITVTSGTFDFA